MKKAKKVQFQIFIILFFAFSFPAESQVLGDTSYFPMHIGNQWTLQSSISNYPQIETIVDTLRLESNLYFRFDQFRDNSQVLLRMVDSEVFRYMDTSEVLWYDFSADTGDSWIVPTPIAGEWTVYLLSKTDTIEAPAGIFTACYHFYFAGIPDYEWEEWFAPGIGIVERRLHGFAFFDWYLSDVIIVSVDEPQSNPGNSFFLYQNYPNPFNPITTIAYSIPNRNHISLKLFDILGCEVSTLVNEEKSAGEYSYIFDGSVLNSGVYFYVLRAGKHTEAKKLLLLK